MCGMCAQGRVCGAVSQRVLCPGRQRGGDGHRSPQQPCPAVAWAVPSPLAPSPSHHQLIPRSKWVPGRPGVRAGQGRLCRNPREKRGQRVLEVGSQTLLGLALILPGSVPRAAPSCPFPSCSSEQGSSPRGRAACAVLLCLARAGQHGAQPSTRALCAGRGRDRRRCSSLGSAQLQLLGPALKAALSSLTLE